MVNELQAKRVIYQHKNIFMLIYPNTQKRSNKFLCFRLFLMANELQVRHVMYQQIFYVDISQYAVAVKQVFMFFRLFLMANEPVFYTHLRAHETDSYLV